MALANAGNPAPYCNGEEMAVEPGLPLGMISEASYEETRYQIAPGDRLMFVSDGVVERPTRKANSMALSGRKPSAISPQS